MSEYPKFKAAIRASGMTLDDMSKAIGMTKPTAIERQENPLQFRLGELVKLHASMDEIGKRLLCEAVSDIFLES